MTDGAVREGPIALPVPPAEPPRAAWRTGTVWLQMLMGGALGGGAVALGIGALESMSPLQAFGLFAVLMASLWGHILVHEAGHAIAGQCAGQQLVAVGIGPWRAERGASRWRVYRAGGIAGIGGFAMLLPRGETLTAAQRAIYLLGGPLSNLLAAAVTLAAVAVGAPEGFARAALQVFAVVGLVIGAVNLVPFVSGGWSSDGRQLLALWRGDVEAQITDAMTRLGALAMLGVRPRDWPSLELPDDPTLLPAMRDALLRCRLVRAMDRGLADSDDAVGAATALASRFRQGPDGLRQLNAVLLASWHHKAGAAPEAVDAWLAEGEGGILDQTASRAGLRAALALRRGDAAEARARLAEARAALPRAIDPASRVMLAEELEALERQLDARV